MESATRPQDASHLAKHLLRIFDVLEHIEDPNEIDLAVRKGQPLGSRESEVNSIRRGTGDR